MTPPATGERRLLAVKLVLFFAAAVLWLVGALLEIPAVTWCAVVLLVGAVLLRWIRR